MPANNTRNSHPGQELTECYDVIESSTRSLDLVATLLKVPKQDVEGGGLLSVVGHLSAKHWLGWFGLGWFRLEVRLSWVYGLVAVARVGGGWIRSTRNSTGTRCKNRGKTGGGWGCKLAGPSGYQVSASWAAR